MPTIDLDDLEYAGSDNASTRRSSPTKRKRKANSVIDLTEDSPDPAPGLVASTSNARPSPSIPRRQSSNEDIVFTGQSQVSPARTRTGRSQSRLNNNALQVPSRPASRFVDLTNVNGSAVVTQDMLPDNARNFLHRQSSHEASSPFSQMLNSAWTTATSIVGSLPLNRRRPPSASPPIQPPPPVQPPAPRPTVARGRGRTGGAARGSPFHMAQLPYDQQDYDPLADFAFLNNIGRGLGGGYMQHLIPGFRPFQFGGPSAPIAQDKPAKYDMHKSHPRKLDAGFRREIVPPDEIVTLDADPGSTSDEYEEVPVCAGCERELFLGNEAEKDSARPYALRCGHLVCAECAAKGKKAKQSPRGKKGKGKKKVVEEGFAPLWTGCPVKSCDGASTAWARKVGHEDGIWDVFL